LAKLQLVKPCAFFGHSVCCHSNETCAPIANMRNSARTTRGHPYHSPNLHPDPCGSEGQTNTQTDTHTVVATIHFASAMPHTKCNNRK